MLCSHSLLNTSYTSFEFCDYFRWVVTGVERSMQLSIICCYKSRIPTILLPTPRGQLQWIWDIVYGWAHTFNLHCWNMVHQLGHIHRGVNFDWSWVLLEMRPNDIEAAAVLIDLYYKYARKRFIKPNQRHTREGKLIWKTFQHGLNTKCTINKMINRYRGDVLAHWVISQFPKVKVLDISKYNIISFPWFIARSLWHPPSNFHWWCHAW